MCIVNSVNFKRQPMMNIFSLLNVQKYNNIWAYIELHSKMYQHFQILTAICLLVYKCNFLFKLLDLRKVTCLLKIHGPKYLKNWYITMCLVLILNNHRHFLTFT